MFLFSVSPRRHMTLSGHNMRPSLLGMRSMCFPPADNDVERHGWGCVSVWDEPRRLMCLSPCFVVRMRIRHGVISIQLTIKYPRYLDPAAQRAMQQLGTYSRTEMLKIILFHLPDALYTLILILHSKKRNRVKFEFTSQYTYIEWKKKKTACAKVWFFISSYMRNQRATGPFFHSQTKKRTPAPDT